MPGAFDFDLVLFFFFFSLAGFRAAEKRASPQTRNSRRHRLVPPTKCYSF
jgi:hypothetical protein